MNDMPDLFSLYKLLTQASALACSSGAQAFLSLLTSEDDRLSLAIDGFIPALQNQIIQIPQRILAAYVLGALYVSHDRPNPFHNHLLRIFESERTVAVAASHGDPSLVGSSRRVLNGGGGMQAENEQLVWVLWKILKGEGDDLAPYSPDTLSSMTLPENLRAVHLIVQDGRRHGNDRQINAMYSSTTEPPRRTLGLPSPATQHPVLHSQPDYSSPALRSYQSSSSPTQNRTPSVSTFSPFDDTLADPHNFPRLRASGGHENESDGWLQEMMPNVNLGGQPRYHPSPNSSKDPYEDTIPSAFPVSVHSQVSEDQRQQTLLRALCDEQQTQSVPELLYSHSGIVGTESRPNSSQNGINSEVRREPSRVGRQLQPPTPAQPRISTQFNTLQYPIQNFPGNHNDYAPTNTSPFTSVASDPMTNIRPRPGPISRPRPNATSYNTTTSSVPSPTSEIISVHRQVSRPQETQSNGELPSEILMRMNGAPQQSSGHLFQQQTRIPTPTTVSQPIRSPGIIGSGRPSASVPQSNSSAGKSPVETRWSQVGIIGSGRSEPSPVRDEPQVFRGQPAREEHEGMIPFSVLRMRSTKEEPEKRGFGAIGPSKNGLSNGRTRNLDERRDVLEELTRLSLGPRLQMPFGKVITSEPSPRTFDSTWPPTLGATETTTTPPSSIITQPQSLFEHRAPTPQSQSIPILAPTVDHDNKNEAASASARHRFSASSLSPSTERAQLETFSENSQISPIGVLGQEAVVEAQINEKERDELSHAIVLLLSARERVLTLSEQRMLQPHLSMLTQPLSLLWPGDLRPLAAKNPDIAAKLLVLLLDRKDEDAAKVEQVLKDASKDKLFGLEHGPVAETSSSPVAASIDSMAAVDAIQTAVKFVSNCGAPSNSSRTDEVSPFGGREAKEGYLDALKKLPPTMQSFNLIAKLLRPMHPAAQEEDSPEARVAVLIRTEVLGGFVSGCVRWIEEAEQEEKEGEVHDDRVAVAISSLCRFYSSLLKHGFVSAASEVDTTEIMRFALQFSRFEEARSLYSTLAAARA